MNFSGEFQCTNKPQASVWFHLILITEANTGCDCQWLIPFWWGCPKCLCSKLQKFQNFGGGLSQSDIPCVLQQLEQACFKILWNTHCPDTCIAVNPILGVNLGPVFVILYFPYAGQCLLFFCWWQQHFEFQQHVWQWKEEAMLCWIHMRNFKSHFQ